MLAIILVVAIVIVVLTKYKTETFTGDCLYFNVFNKYRDPYSIPMWREMYKKHQMWNDMHRVGYVPYSGYTLG